MPAIQEFLRFVRSAPTAFHAAHSVLETLCANGYTRICEEQPFSLLPGGKYCFLRGDSAAVAFQIPERRFTHFQIVASHADSPVFKVKGLQETESCSLLRLPTEEYGGMIRYSWLDRPLSIAGRVYVRTASGLSSRLVNLDRDSALIPSMPIHLNRDMNKGIELNPQTDLYPLVGASQDRGWIRAAVAEAAGCECSDLVAGDLFLYNRTPGSIWGPDSAFFSCPRIDDLECAFASLSAFMHAAPPEGHVNLFVLFDNEEVGSGSPQGADSDMLTAVIRRICLAFGVQAEPAVARSFLISADNAHASHPAHPEKYDDLFRCFMNSGIVVKHSAPLRYTTDAESDAIFSQILHRCRIPVQHFWNRSDMPGGSTLGHIAVAHTSVRCIDIGLAQLAMHSSYETAGVFDLDYLIQALTSYYETDIRFAGPGEIHFE